MLYTQTPFAKASVFSPGFISGAERVKISGGHYTQNLS
jgi:hypothetical protein